MIRHVSFLKGTEFEVIVLNIKYTSRLTTWQFDVNPLAPTPFE
jgi:hypothetical protein